MALSQLGSARRELDEADAAILDVSCGPGMFAEMFARGSEFPRRRNRLQPCYVREDA